MDLFSFGLRGQHVVLGEMPTTMESAKGSTSWSDIRRSCHKISEFSVEFGA